MANTQELREYLIEKDPFLLNNDNNGKTIMLSGAWGAGKTHFWQNKIEPTLQSELKKKDKACVYVSLYGKTSIDEIKLDIFQKAYNSIVKADVISKSASLLNSIAPHFGEKSTTDIFNKLNKKFKDKKSKEILQDGTVICLDDFERKSKDIDLNDLFGFISHLALEMQYKVVIILNSDVFEGKEAEVFKNVKEKTVNKYLYFKPTIKELFESIYDNEAKYNTLNDYKENILEAIKETDELNARLYIQVLDNCLEWHQKRELNDNSVRVLVLATINFVLNHMVLEYSSIEVGMLSKDRFGGDIGRPTVLQYSKTTLNYINLIKKALLQIVSRKEIDDRSQYLQYIKDKKLTIVNQLEEIINIQNPQVVNEVETIKASKWLENNDQEIEALWKYGYQLYYVADVDEETYNEIAKFIESGILLKRGEA